MAYTTNMPLPGDNPSQSQPLIQANFDDISTVISVNHVGFNNADQGKHNFLQLPEQASGPATAANELGFYSKESSLTSVAEMFIRRESNGTEIEFTSSLNAANGWTRLPSGILIKWGTGSGTGNNSTSFPVAGTIPVFTAVFNGVVCVEDSSGTPNTFVTLVSISTTAVTVFSSRRTSTASVAATYRYFIIGS